jgi:hypothetical protein
LNDHRDIDAIALGDRRQGLAGKPLAGDQLALSSDYPALFGDMPDDKLQVGMIDGHDCHKVRLQDRKPRGRQYS